MSLNVYLEVSVDTGGKEPHVIELYDANITHNLGPMADAAGIYYHLWRPEEIGINTAGQLIEQLEKGLERLKSNRRRFESFNPANGWGTYEGFVSFVEKYLQACKDHPKAEVIVSR